MRSTIAGLFCALTLLACHEQTPEQMDAQPPTQRVRAMTILTLGINPTERSVATIVFEGTTYPVQAIDSMNFSYDAQQRLIGDQLQQTVRYSGKLITSQAPDRTYTYQDGYMYESTSRYQLDSAQRRVLSYTRRGYSYTAFDSLRQYSPEGLLLSALQTELTNPPSFQPVGPPTTLIITEEGNSIRKECYEYGSRFLTSLTRYAYDNKHFGPLAIYTFRGEASRHALLKETIIYYSRSSYRTVTYSYTNQYDGQNRLICQLAQNISNPSAPEPLTVTKYYY